MGESEHIERWYKRVTWCGIILNLLFVVPLVFAPTLALKILHLEVEPLIWARIPGLLLFAITALYVPAAINLRKYWALAWIAIYPSRGNGALFFFAAVLIFGQPLGFLPIAFVDLIVLLIQLVLLTKARKLGYPKPYSCD
jgi:hypothetical protein